MNAVDFAPGAKGVYFSPSINLVWCQTLCCMFWHVSVGGTAAAAPPPFRPGNPALCGSHPLVTPYYCRLGFAAFCVYCVIIVFFCVNCVLCVPSVLWYCWLGLVTCKNRRPYNLYCVGGDVKPCVSSGCNTCCLMLYSHVGTCEYCWVLDAYRSAAIRWDIKVISFCQLWMKGVLLLTQCVPHVAGDGLCSGIYSRKLVESVFAAL